MSPGITFRCTCEHCGAIFFSPDRKATACMKCAKRHRIRVESAARPAPEPDDDLFAAALSAGAAVGEAPPRRPSASSHRPASGTAPGAVQTPGSAHRAPARVQPPATRSPRATELTDEKRAEVLRAYEAYEGRDEVPLRRIHAEIAEKTNLARALVASVIAEVRTPPAALDDDQREAIIARYREYVRTMARPPAGRRATIARDLNVSRQQVVTVVREWASTQPSITDLSRTDLFRIERAYCTAAAAQAPFEGLAARIAQELGYTEWQVERWIDMLHDGDFSDVEEPSPDQREAVISAYHEYLAGDGPPSKSLHLVLGDRFGLTPRQVHKTLVEYRLDLRQTAFGF